ncbi:MAG: glycosyltransferase family 2 protein, partial [Paracoccus sp. (in: a-proteobacteria)]
MTPAEQLRLIKSSKQIHTNWYKATYPDVVELGIEPALHYLRYGAAMGRNPGKNFDTRYYLRTCPEAAKSGLNPLVHYVLHGRAKGVATLPPRSPGAKHVASVRTRLLSLGFTERPLAELADIQANAKLPGTRALAARELALWHMRTKTPEGYHIALQHLQAARTDAPDLDFCRKLAVAELMCHHFLGDEDAARDTYERAALAGEVSPDLLLARANLEFRPKARVALMNRVLAQFDIAPVALAGDGKLPAYDRLTVTEELPQISDGPKVTVLIAAYEAADTLPTALRSLQAQTWQNLEILVLDDCSPSPDTCRVAEEFAARDPRIRLIRMEQNAGAYVARNRGLDE